MTRSRILSLLELAVVSILLAGYLVFLIQHRTFFPLPNSDVFQYLYHAQAYLSGVLPCDQQVPPFYPFLLGSVFWFSSFWFSYSGIEIAIFLNIIFSVGSLFIVWLLSKRLIANYLRIPLLFFLIMHPLTAYGALNTTPEPIFLFFTLLSFYFFETKKQLAFLCALVASMIKVDGLILVGIYVYTTLLPLIKLNQIQIKNFFSRCLQFCCQQLGFMLMVGVAGVWSLWSIAYGFLFNRNPETSNYLTEVLVRSSDLPEWRIISHLPRVFTADIQAFSSLTIKEDYFFTGTIFFLLLLLGVTFTHKPKQRTAVIIQWFYLMGYITLHFFFPAYSIRYFLPVLALFSLLSLNSFSIFFEKIKKNAPTILHLGIGASALLFLMQWGSIQYHYQFWPFLSADRLVANEYKWAADWANENASSKSQLYFISSPYTAADYLKQINTPYFKYFDRTVPRVCTPQLQFKTFNKQGSILSFAFPLSKDMLGCSSYTCTRDQLLPGAEIFLVNTTDDAPKLIQEREPSSGSPRQEYVNNCLEHMWGRWEGVHFAQVFRLKENCSDL